MPDEDKNFGGSLVFDFRKWWRHVKTIYKRGGRIIEAGSHYDATRAP